jgi:hypothetical protein
VLTPLAQRVLDFTPFKIFNCCKVWISPRVEGHYILRSIISGKNALANHFCLWARSHHPRSKINQHTSQQMHVLSSEATTLLPRIVLFYLFYWLRMRMLLATQPHSNMAHAWFMPVWEFNIHLIKEYDHGHGSTTGRTWIMPMPDDGILPAHCSDMLACHQCSLPKAACRHFKAAAGVRALYTVMAGVGIIQLLSPTCHNTFRSHEV